MVKYDLHLLGWNAFQQLCLMITREILGQTVSVFLESNDAGKDGAFAGIWNHNGSEDLSGKFVIQCKYTNRTDHNLTLSELEEEFTKIETLVKNGECDCYILMTNAGISGRFDSLFKKKTKSLGVKFTIAFGSNWISTQISESKKLRMLVPRVYGLGDLSQIIDKRVYDQARQLLNSMRDELSKIVITSAYYKAATAINEYGFVLIIGEPAAGKTTIASLLAMGALDQWGLSTIKIDRPDQVIKHWNTEDPTQFIWIDDAFGVQQYEDDLVKSWNHILPQVKSMLKQGIKIVVTSRDYIYARARTDLKQGAFPLFNESQVVIDVHKLSHREKEQILYNHLKLGRQNKEFVQKVKPFLPKIANHDRFIPETARRLADPAYTKEITFREFSLLEFVGKQESFLKDVLRGLDKDSKAALALIYMNNGHLVSPVKPSVDEENAIRRLGSHLGACLNALEAMKDSLVQYTLINDDTFWRFKHPTIGDAYASIVASSPEQLEIYLQGTDIEKIMDQVTCGDVRMEKAIILPKAMYPIIQRRLANFRKSDTYKVGYYSEWNARRKLKSFLARRSSRDFLEFYLSESPEILDNIVKPSMSFRYSEDIDLILKLQSQELLPEVYRKAFVEYVSSITISGNDLFLLSDDDLQKVFKDDELQIVKDKVKNELLPKLSSLRYQRESEFREHNNDSSEDHMEDFFDKTRILLEVFENEPIIIEKVEDEVRFARNWVEENNFDSSPQKSDRILDTTDEHDKIVNSRSIFDDIDL